MVEEKMLLLTVISIWLKVACNIVLAEQAMSKSRNLVITPSKINKVWCVCENIFLLGRGNVELLRMVPEQESMSLFTAAVLYASLWD